MKINNTYTTISIIILTGIIIRGIILFHICEPDKIYPTLDEMNYRELAENVINYKQYATWSEGFLSQSTRAPVFPMMIGTSYIISGNTKMSAVKFLNTISDIFSIFLIFLVGRKLFNKKTALISAGLYSIFGHALYYMQISNPHTFAVMLLLLTSLALIHLKDSYKIMFPIFSILYAVLIHTRPVFLVALPAVLPAVYFQISSKKGNNNNWRWLFDSWKQKLLKSVIPLALITTLCLPWGIRNYKLHHTIVPVCTVAGWHIASNINFDLKLSIKYLTDHIYAPDHKNYSEGDFFDLGKSIFYNSIKEHPFKIPAFGLARLIFLWSPPVKPFYRFILPKAYIYPIYISDSLRIPLPDFEGFIYIIIFATFAAIYKLRKKTLAAFSYIFYKGRGLWCIIGGYTFVHIIGIPLISYRFIIEPLLIIFGIALILKYIEKFITEKNCELRNNLKEITPNALPEEEIEKTKLDKIILISATIIIISSIFSPLIYPGTPRHREYTTETTEKLTYPQLREIQWQNLGNIPPETEITLQGVVKYLHTGFKYPTDDYYAVKNPDFAAGRIFVRFGDKSTPLGIGDVRVNFPADRIPENGEIIEITGEAETGLFKEIIINVETFKHIDTKYY